MEVKISREGSNTELGLEQPLLSGWQLHLSTPTVPAYPLVPGWAPGSRIQMTIKYHVRWIPCGNRYRKTLPGRLPWAGGGWSSAPASSLPLPKFPSPFCLAPPSALPYPLLSPRTQRCIPSLASLSIPCRQPWDLFPPGKVSAYKVHYRCPSSKPNGKEPAHFGRWEY